MKIVVKIGGTLLEDPVARQRMAAMVAAEFRADNKQVLLIHGGGKQLTAYLEKTGVQSEFRNGLRVTTAEAIDGVVKVFAGTVNHNLLAAFVAEGVRAAGISGIDGACLLAEQLRDEQGRDWGFVGRIIQADSRLWQTLLDAGILPVMACLAVGADGQIYNVNADQAAVACAAAWKADRLVFLTDVDGVEDGRGQRMESLACEDIAGLIRAGTVSGGMEAKLNAIAEAARNGLHEVHICNGHLDGVLQRALDTNEQQSGTGTRIRSGRVPETIN